MDVLTTRERINETGVLCEVGDTAQLDLVVVRDGEHVAGPRNEGLAELASLLAAHRDVVQVWLVGTQAAGAGDGLVEGGVNAPIRCHLCKQTLAVGGAKLLELAVVEQRVDELGPLVSQLLQCLRVGGEACLRLLHWGEFALLEKDLAQLNGRVEVELPPSDLVHLGHESLALGGEPLVECAQFGDVDRDTCVLHAGEDPHKRVLDVAVQRSHPLCIECRLDCGSKAGHSKGSAGRGDDLVGRAVTKVELATRCAPGRKGVAGVPLEQIADRVPTVGWVEKIGSDGSVERK